jgi:hypothetical protein
LSFNNIRGFRAPGRARQLTELLKDQKVDIVCLQETITQNFSVVELNSLSSGVPFVWHMVPARGHSGGLLVGVNDDVFECISKDQGVFFCSFVVTQRSTCFKWEIVEVPGLKLDRGHGSDPGGNRGGRRRGHGPDSSVEMEGGSSRRRWRELAAATIGSCSGGGGSRL